MGVYHKVPQLKLLMCGSVGKQLLAPLSTCETSNAYLENMNLPAFHDVPSRAIVNALAWAMH
jgi:hypothetical protein